ncbi:hypothetical protein Cni_G13512 [Canna indica]|uniref:Uncharacterized protein n=1 Tax=Canna indica TaxID=4628 RepID=A0AAQ3KC44_9LILI|nr:hypothetical protein Cni_G13512 [Canna indica]
MMKPGLGIKSSLAHQQMKDRSFYFIRNSGNKASRVNKHFVGCSYSEDHVLVDGRKKINAEESAAHVSREDIRFVLENFDNRRHELGTLEHREAVNLHVNGVKRKVKLGETKVNTLYHCTCIILKRSAINNVGQLLFYTFFNTWRRMQLLVVR